MPLFQKIIFLLLSIICFSCKTKLERQGWQRTAIVSQLDTSSKKDKELVVKKMHGKSAYYYRLYIFEKDSTGKIINNRWWGYGNFFNSDIAYYKWESDSVCLVKLSSQGNVQASLKLGFGLSHEPGVGYWNSLDVLDELKK